MGTYMILLGSANGYEDLLYLSCVMRKPAFCICEKKAQINCAVTAKLISAFVFPA